MKKPFNRFVIAFLSLAGATASADVKMPALFGNHMVLQQETKVPVWGLAEPREKVTVTCGDHKAMTIAGTDGAWRVDLTPFENGAPAQTLVVAGHNTLTFTDVLVGDVWVASGQSNMGFPLNSAHTGAEEINKATDPELRLFVVTRATAAEPLNDVKGQWVLCDPKSAAGFSAVAYYYAKAIRQNLHRPIGVIGTYWGGTPAQAWTPLASIAKQPTLSKYASEYGKAMETHKAVMADPKIAAEYEEQTRAWKKEIAPAFDAAMKKYNLAADAAKAAGQPVPPKPVAAKPEPVNPDPMGMPNSGSRPHVPSVIYNAMVAPCIPYAIKGVIWYQGEANGGAGIEYRTLFPALITGWREAWGQGDFPFLYVQLPNWNSSGKEPQSDEWAFLREAQAMTLSLPNTGMAVTIDIGDPGNVHPKDKIDVGNRLALVGRKAAYGQDLIYTGPRYDAMKIEGNAIRVHFTQIGGGLTIGTPPWIAPGAKAPPTDHLSGFTIAGADKKFVPASAKIDGDSVIVSSPNVASPIAVRYGWLNSPTCNLYNKEQLPAAPFRTDVDR